MSPLPEFFRVRQDFPRPIVKDVAGEVRNQLARLDLGKKISAGDTVAISAGSRGIANIVDILKAAADYLRSLGADPFLVPAMGSHGGGTAHGQVEMLASYGITEASCGLPIRASMETVVVCQTAEGVPVHFDRHAYEADHVLVCNRIKPHTRFNGPLQSGLVKMMLIGLGKHEGAKTYHSAFADFEFDAIARSVSSEVIRRCGILAGLATIENSYKETAQIAALPPEEFIAGEEKLLILANELLPRLPFDSVDLLILDQIGKNISGTGMDTNVVGRKHDDGKAVEGELPRVKRIFARSLTGQSHGNAIGVGVADFVTDRLVADIDWQATYVNGLTSGHVGGVKLPPHYATDREALEAALTTVGLVAPQDAHVVWIRDTLNLVELECSAAYLEAAEKHEALTILSGNRPLPLDAKGNLPEFMDQFAAD